MFGFWVFLSNVCIYHSKIVIPNWGKQAFFQAVLVIEITITDRFLNASTTAPLQSLKSLGPSEV